MLTFPCSLQSARACTKFVSTVIFFRNKRLKADLLSVVFAIPRSALSLDWSALWLLFLNYIRLLFSYFALKVLFCVFNKFVNSAEATDITIAEVPRLM